MAITRYVEETFVPMLPREMKEQGGNGGGGVVGNERYGTQHYPQHLQNGPGEMADLRLLLLMFLIYPKHSKYLFIFSMKHR